MKAFLRENPTIAFGLGLPLVLVVVFLLISGIPALLVDPPQYEVLYATEYYNYGSGVQISVIDRKVKVIYQGSYQGAQRPRIWRFNPDTGAVKEIAFVLPPGLAPPPPGGATPEALSQITPIEVPDLEGLTIDSSSIAPDGYAFNTGQNNYSGDVFTGLFYSARYRNETVITKKGRSIRLPNFDGNYYGYNTHFIGWVIPP